MTLTVPLDEARLACRDSVAAFVRAADIDTEYELLGASRCHGWTRLDVLVHVIAGWQDMLGGLVSRVDDDPDVDAASYWRAFATEYATGDPVPTLMSQRRRSAAYARPSTARQEMHDVSAALLRGIDGLQGPACAWQGHVFAPGDFLTVWAVEIVVHHLDLRSAEPAPASALRLARATIETLAGQALPPTWTDLDATLIGTGRSPVPEGWTLLASRLPAIT